MAFWKTDKLIDTSDIPQILKENEKNDSKNVKLFGSTKKEEKLYSELPGMRGKSDSSEFTNNTLQEVDDIDSLKSKSISALDKSSRESLQADKDRVKLRNPIKILAELSDKNNQYKDILLSKTEKAGKLYGISQGIKQIFQKRANQYLSDHKGENNKHIIADALNGLTSKYGKTRNNTLLEDMYEGGDFEELHDIFENSFNYIAYKTAQWIADKDEPDVESIKEDIKTNLAQVVGVNKGISLQLLGNGYKKQSVNDVRKSFNLDKLESSKVVNNLKKFNDDKLNIFFRISDLSIYDRNKVIYSYSDLMEFYKDMNPEKENEKIDQFFIDRKKTLSDNVKTKNALQDDEMISLSNIDFSKIPYSNGIIWDWLVEHEGGIWLTTRVDNNSGVIIGIGCDLSNQSAIEMRKNNGVAESIIRKLLPYMGKNKTKQLALDLNGGSGRGLPSDSKRLEQEGWTKLQDNTGMTKKINGMTFYQGNGKTRLSMIETLQLARWTFNKYVSLAKKGYEAFSKNMDNAVYKNWSDLPGPVKTSLIDVIYKSGDLYCTDQTKQDLNKKNLVMYSAVGNFKEAAKAAYECPGAGAKDRQKMIERCIT